MYPKLLHIYGPFFINSYGTMIALGLALFAWLVNKDPRRAKLISSEHFYWMIILGIISGIMGGRILYFILEWQTVSLIDFFALWHGGFAVLGSLIGILCVAPWYLKKHKIPLLPFLDLIALYAPLLQSISRIGCFLAGCCYGKPSQVFWAVRYHDSACIAPLHVSLHPSQLYSAILLFGIFCLLYFFIQFRVKKSGQLLSVYVLLMALERYYIDFFRWDQLPLYTFLGSAYQTVAVVLILLAIGFLIVIAYSQPSPDKSS